MPESAPPQRPPPQRPMGRPPKWEIQRPIVMKMVEEGHAYIKISELAGVPVSTIRTWVKNAREAAT